MDLNYAQALTMYLSNHTPMINNLTNQMSIFKLSTVLQHFKTPHNYLQLL